MKLIAAIVTSLALAACTAAPPATPYVGMFRGEYTCPQGATDLTLSIDSTAPEEATAVFRFTFTDSATQIATTGSFNMRGTFDPATRRITLTGTDWVEQPDETWWMIDMVGTFDEGYSSLQGNIETEGCGAFSLNRVG